MHKIKVRIKKTHSNKEEVIAELIQAEARLNVALSDASSKSLFKNIHNNLLDILNYIECDEPYCEDSEYIDKFIRIHETSYPQFKKTIEEKQLNMKDYLELLLNKYYQLDTNFNFLTLQLQEGNTFYFLNENTIKVFLYKNYFTSEFLLLALKILKADERSNSTLNIYFKIMQMYILKLKENGSINEQEYNLYLEGFKTSKINNEIDFLEKIIFLRHKLGTEIFNNKNRSRIFKDLYKKYNSRYHQDTEQFIRNEIHQYLEESEYVNHDYDVFSLGNFKKRLHTSQLEFHKYTDNLKLLLSKGTFKMNMCQNLDVIDEILDEIMNI